jgi:hypothetical protein
LLYRFIFSDRVSTFAQLGFRLDLDPPTSTSQAARITGTPDHAQLGEHFFLVLVGLGFFDQGFVLAKQALYHLSNTSSPFCFGYSGDGGLMTICPEWPQILILPISVS